MISGPTRAFAEAFVLELEQAAAVCIEQARDQWSQALICNQLLLQATVLLRVAAACRKAAGG